MTQLAKDIQQSSYLIDPEFESFINREVLPHTHISADTFWGGFVHLLETFVPRNQALLARRDELQGKIDQWHLENKGELFDAKAYRAFLEQIGYLLPEVDDFTVSPANVDDEIASIAGPQLVVPVRNARFALNAVNARWGSLYDALYGTDTIPQTGDLKSGKEYNQQRGQAVIAFAKAFIDQHFPLQQGSHENAVGYSIDAGQLLVAQQDGSTTTLADQEQFIAFTGNPSAPASLLLKHHKLHVEILINRSGSVGATDPAGIEDIQLEAAVTTIIDCEDSVAVVDVECKVEAYRNWLGLIRGRLEAQFNKAGQTQSRQMRQDKIFTHKSGHAHIVPGRSLMLIRNVGHLLKCELAIDAHGDTIPEGIVDALVTALIATIDLNGQSERKNTRTGSIYIVKPKMHGPEEVAFSNDLFNAVEDILGLERNTIKLGIMDEERRTTVNLKACIYEARERVIFINTGFLDRTGDEIHTSMEAGPFLPKAELKNQPWIKAYEDWNVDTGLECGLQGNAQIGKGMWAMPDLMNKMMEEKVGHPKAGANTAWVPSPTAATLHAMHYHQVDVQAVQKELMSRPKASLDDILTIPIMHDPESLSEQDIERELENNVQGILGYVVRWIDRGVGCSKVPDINHVGLMEDRATLRISSQHIANWLHHGICSQRQVLSVMGRVVHIVDEQNAGDPGYIPMATSTERNLAFQAAKDLIFMGRQQPNGYTEIVLHKYRLLAKFLAARRRKFG